MARMRRVGSATVGRIYAEFTGRKARERESLQCPRILGIDEHRVHRGLPFATTFCDLKNRRIFDIVPGRSERELAAFLSRLQGREKSRWFALISPVLTGSGEVSESLCLGSVGFVVFSSAS